MTKRYHFEIYCFTIPRISIMSEVLFLFDMMMNYFMVRAMTREAMTEAALTMVEITVSLYELF